MIELLSAGGDLATMALLFVMWKFDRRLLSLEIKMLHLPKRKEDKD